MNNTSQIDNHSLAFGDERILYSVSDSSLVSLLKRAALEHANKGFVSILADGRLKRKNYGELLSDAAKICGGLQQAGIKPAQKVLLQIDDAADLFMAMWGCILAGAIPIPLNVALAYNNKNQTQKLVNVWNSFDQPIILTCEVLSSEISDVSQFFSSFVPSILSLESLQQAEKASQFYQAESTEVAVLFLTSGSTGIPKGVPQTHGNILAMVDGTIQMNGFTEHDVTLNWMSMDHAGSLVFLGVMGVALKSDQFHVPISYVLQQPLRWLDLIHQHRITISWAPNFVFSLFLEKTDEISKGHWDLSCMRFMVNAGEAIVSRTARNFIRMLEQHKLPTDALRPAFGMVETCSGITWSTGFTLENSEDDDSFVDLGPCIPGASIRIIDDNDQLVPEQQSGRLQLRGPSVFSGYHNQAELNNKIMTDDWFTTGDLAFLRNGHLFITGREKDMIIINGNNFYCHEIEAAVEQLTSITRGSVAACGVDVVGKNTEQLAILYHCHETDEGIIKQLNKRIRNQLMEVVGVSPSIMVRLELDEFPRTAIGKIQRPQLKKQLEKGDFEGRNLLPEKRSGMNRKTEAIRKSKANSALADQIAEIWCQVLELDDLSYEDTFFELGGHSLLAFQVQAELEKLIGRQIAIIELFNTPTITLMAEYFSAEQNTQEETKESLEADNASAQDMAIAVIGLSCRLPGANGPEEFWQNLKEGNESITFYSAEEAIKAGLTPEQANNPNHVHAVPMLSDVEGFDADFWKYSAREARIIDPQQRIFLETAWEAFEDAGYTPESMKQVGVFASAGTNTYLLNNIFANSQWIQEDNQGSLLTVDSTSGFNVMITNDKDYLPMRVSYKLNLTGPSVNIQTACSSTLVAIHEACKSIRSGESEVALAGGCAAMLPQHAGHLYSEGMLVTPDGHCRAYDAGANGTIFGSGSGAVLLKRLDKAIADKDNIYAVIRGSAVANDGGQKMGFTAPSMMGEYSAARKALDRAGISADTLGFIEGHGTGTPLGDPIEVQALSKAIRHDSERNQFCALGSVKTNIGHMGIASGIAGALKAVLAINNKQIPATLHYEKANPQIDFESSPFFVNNKLLDWESSDIPRRAGVNSLGIGGTNAHIIFEQGPNREDLIETTSVEILPLSSKTPKALRALIKKYVVWLKAHPNIPLRNICFTAQQGRKHFSCRRAFVATNHQQLLSELEHSLTESLDENKPNIGKGPVYLFTGQGAQYVSMAKKLYETEDVFKQSVDQCANLFKPFLEHDLLQVMFEATETNTQRLNQTNYTQPALFVIQVALIRLLEDSGISPSALIGHSIGEFAAAWCAGVFNLEDAIKLVATRGRLMHALPDDGAMAAVLTNKEHMQQVLSEADVQVSIAAYNAPENQVISGKKVHIDAAINALESAGVTTNRLQVSHAFHSELMEPILEEFRSVVEQVSLSRPQIAFISSLTGDLADDALATTDYWVQHISEPVNCQQAIKQALTIGHGVFVELGPHPVMSSFGLQIATKEKPVLWQACLRRNNDDLQCIQAALAALYQSGCDLDWVNINVSKPAYRVSLPTYPWQRVKHWIEADKDLNHKGYGQGFTQTSQIDPLLGERIALPHIQQELYRSVFDCNHMSVLADHRVFGHIIPPGAMYAAKFMRTAIDVFSRAQVRVDNLMFMKPMIIKDNMARDVQVILSKQENAVMKCELNSCAADNINMNSTLQIHATAEVTKSSEPLTFVDLNALKAACPNSFAVSAHQEKMQAMHIELGNSFDWLSSIQTGNNQAIATISIPQSLLESDATRLHPGLIDAHWQVLIEAMSSAIKGTVIPFCIDSFICHALPENGDLWCHAQWDAESHKNGRFRGDIKLISADGKVLIETKGLELRHADEVDIRSVLEEQIKEEDGVKEEEGIDEWFYNTNWQEVTLANDFYREGDCLIIGCHPMVTPLSDNLKKQHKEVITLTKLEQRAQIATDVTAILAEHTQIKTVVFIADEMQIDDVSEGCQQLLGAIQVLIQQNIDNLRFVLVTQNSQNVTNTAINTSHAALWGIASSLKHEQPHISVLRLDLDSEPNQSLQSIADYIMGQKDDETQVAIRHNSHYVPVLESIPYDNSLSQISLSENSVQVIVGGNGGLGGTIAQWMVDCGAQTIIVAGRNTPTEQSQSVFSVLAEQGATIELVKCDVTLLSDVKQLMSLASESGHIQSVFHLAGTLDDGFIQNLDEDSFNKVLSPKLLGAWNLHQLMSEHSPEFFVLFSSVASIFGSAGQAAYAAGNTALDALANYRRQQGLPALSINWGPWSDVGMAANMDKRHKQRLLEQGYQTIEPKNGLHALTFAMSNVDQYSQVMVAPIEAKLISQLPGQRGLLRNIVGAQKQDVKVLDKPQQSALVTDLAKMTNPQRKQRLEQYLLKLVKDMLQVDFAKQLDVDKGLFDLGMDSLTAVEVKDRLERDIGCKLRSTLAFDYPTIRRMAAFLIETLYADSSEQKYEVKENEAKDHEVIVPEDDSELDGLSESELAEMLMKEID